MYKVSSTTETYPKKVIFFLKINIFQIIHNLLVLMFKPMIMTEIFKHILRMAVVLSTKSVVF